MLRTIQNIAIGVFIISVAILTLVAVLAIWDFFEKDVLYKSLSTIGVISFASLIIIVATRAIEKHQNKDVQGGGPVNYNQ